MQKLLKSLILLSLFFMSGQLTYAATLGLDDTEEPVFILKDDDGNNLNNLFFSLGGDGSTPEAAITIYLPINSGTENSAYYLSTTKLPDASSEQGGIYFFDIDSKGYSNEELYVAVKDNDNGSSAEYRIVTQIPSGEVENPFVSYFKLCTTTELNCAGFTNKLSTIKEDVELVFFFKPDGTDYPTNENDITIPETVGQALYFKIIISAASDDIQNNSSLSVNETFDGDSIGILEYSGSHGGNGAYISRLALYYNSTPATPVKGDFKDILEGQNEDGTAKVRNLTNGTTYRAGIAYLDHFGFIGAITESANINPKPIEKLLAENQCYLVTAGFGHDHYVLDYFRYIRDEYLMETWAGRLFVELYYGSAPSFVKYILNNKALAFTIKLYSFSMYFILHNILFIIGCITLLSTYIYKREIKQCLTKY